MPAKKATKRGKPAAKTESVAVDPKSDPSPLDETFVVKQKIDDAAENAASENGSNDEAQVGNSKTDSDEAEVSKKKGKAAAKKPKEKPAEKPVEDEADDVESTCKYCLCENDFLWHLLR